MNKLNLSIGFLLTIILLSCRQKDVVDNSLYIKDLVEFKKIELPVDEQTYYLSKRIFPFEEDGKEYLSFGNLEKKQYEILIYDIAGQNLHRRIPLMKEGPDGVPAIMGLKPFWDSQSFIVFQHNIGKISLINGQGKVLKRYTIQEDNGPFISCGDGFSYFHVPSFVKDSIVYFQYGTPDREFREKYGWGRAPLFASLNFKTGNVDKLPIYHPSFFNQKIKNLAGGDGFTYDYNYKQNRLVCSFTGHDSLMVTDDLKTVRWYNGKSRYADIVLKLYEVDDDWNWLRKAEESPQYHNVMYDKFRDVYYRFVQLPYELKAKESPMGEKYDREFSVIIFDKDFKIIGETKFPGNKYFFKMSFVGRDGLYISENNLNNPEFDEDKLVFACFKLADEKQE